MCVWGVWVCGCVGIATLTKTLTTTTTNMVGATTTAGVTGAGGVFLTAIMSSGVMENAYMKIESVELPLSSVNTDKSLLSSWVTEDIETFDDEPLTSECNFFNFSTQYTGEFCDAFTISRMQYGTVQVASNRALKCASKTNTECVLSPEIGLAIPAVFFAAPESSSGIKTFIAPRVTTLPTDITSIQKHVRVSSPIDAFNSRTIVMNDTLHIEYMTEYKTLKSEIVSGQYAFCINLLRVAYEASCWKKLDG